VVCFRDLRLHLAEGFVSDWRFAQKNASEELAQLHLFSYKKCHKDGDVVFQITVKEYAAQPPGMFARFFAQADKPVNQSTGPFLPTGWGNSVLDALSDCVRMIREFPYEGENQQASKTVSGP
jgi:hypothetical protein